MNFAQMLMRQVIPQSLQGKVERRGGSRKNNDLTAANLAKSAQSQAKYAAAMRGDWTQTVVIETRMGMGRSTIFKTLVAYERRGLVERRPAGGAEHYNRRRGWEWRWVK